MGVTTKDILYKAAEDVQQGMWCRDFWFAAADGTGIEATDGMLVAGTYPLEEALKARRCAEGSIAIATALLGGDQSDLFQAQDAVRQVCYERYATGIIGFNDDHLPDDPFEAGQQLAELFRETADAL